MTDAAMCRCPSQTPVYTRYFEFFRARDDAFREMVYQIRYDVFCEERGFLNPVYYPDHSEKDPYDGSSVHFVGRHRESLKPAGTVRVVLNSARGFPLQSHCELAPEYQFARNPGDRGLERYAEISRLAVVKGFRQRSGDTYYGGPPRLGSSAGLLLPNRPHELGMNPLEAGPEIIAGLYKCIYQESKRLGLTHWVIAIERSLQLLLRRMGYHFLPIGPVVDYYGPVRPCIACIHDVERYVYQRRRLVFDYWMDGLEAGCVPASESLCTPLRPARAIRRSDET